MQEFLAHGYTDTSMDRIAAAAGVSKATIYSHFQDKADLFTAIIQRLAEHKFSTFFDPRDAHALQGEPRLVLRQLTGKMYEQALQDTQFCEFMRLIIGESGRFPELAKPYIENIAKPFIQALSAYLESRHELRLKDPEATARTLMGTMIYFIMLQEMLHGREMLPMSPERMVDNLIDLIVPK
ncbi:MAG: helix-turn-helix transcriptional regulator [Leptolyngbya sp. SIO4C1]|nr:helix-turn-helix transcriptional regulator [Leptolyngbya sp. SIO4C1]